MFDNPHTVQITFRPLVDVPEADLSALATHLTSGLDSAEVTRFEGEPAVKVFLRVYCFKPAANMVAVGRLEQRLGDMEIVVLRSRLLPARELEAGEMVHFTQGLARSRWPGLRRARTDLGLLDTQHTVHRAVGRFEAEDPQYLALDDDVDFTWEYGRGLGTRRAVGPAPSNDTGWRLWRRVALAPVVISLPGVTAAGGVMGWPIWVLVLLLGGVLVGGPAVWRFFSSNAKRHWIVPFLGTAAWVIMSGIAGWGFAHEWFWPGWGAAFGAVVFLALHWSTHFLLRERPDLLRPAMLFSVLAPSITFGSVLWGWATVDGMGIPGEALGLSVADQLWMAWPSLYQLGSIVAGLVIFCAIFKWFGFWTAARGLWKIFAELLAVMLACAWLLSGSHSAAAQVVELKDALKNSEIPDNVLGSRVSWVCIEPVEPGKPIASYGGMPVAFGARPLAHIHTTDGNVWLWDPRAAGISDRAVAYPASALTVRVVASGRSICR